MSQCGNCHSVTVTLLSAVHDGEGWCIKAERHGEAPYYFECYAVDTHTAHWTAGQVAKGYSSKVEPPRLN